MDVVHGGLCCYMPCLHVGIQLCWQHVEHVCYVMSNYFLRYVHTTQVTSDKV